MTAAPVSSSTPLGPLLARIWRDYLSHHKAALFTGMVCAGVAGGMSAALLGLLEPAVNGLFVQGGETVRLFGHFVIPSSRALVVVPIAIVLTALVRTLAAAGQASLVNRLGHGIVGDIQVRLFGAMIRADLARLRNQHSGGFVSTVLFDAHHRSGPRSVA